MNIIIKKTAAVFCMLGLVISACGCDNADSGNSSEAGSETITTVAEKTEDTRAETVITEAETSNKETDDDNPFQITFDDSDIEDNDDIRLARECLLEFENSIVNDRESADLGKYIDNKYLKEYLDEHIAASYEGGNNPSYWKLNIRTQEYKQSDGKKYITFNCLYSAYYNHSGSVLTRPVVVVENGKVVDYSDLYFMRRYDNVWNSGITEDMAKNGGFDLSKFPNIWEDKKLAERAVEALKKFNKGESESYSEAWDILEEV